MAFWEILANAARNVGMQAQNIAVVDSSVDQNVVGTLSHVGSAIKPKVRRLSSRTMAVKQTLYERRLSVKGNGKAKK